MMAPEFLACLGCGNGYDDNTAGCYADELCQDCTPAAGRCFDCRDQRRDEMTERMVRYASENEVCS